MLITREGVSGQTEGPTAIFAISLNVAPAKIADASQTEGHQKHRAMREKIGDHLVFYKG